MNGIVLTLHPTNSDAESESHLISAKCRVVFTCASLLTSCLRVTDGLGIFRDRIYLLDEPGDSAVDAADEEDDVEEHQTFAQLVTEGSQLPSQEHPQWKEGQGSQIAFLAATSGTSGMQVCSLQADIGRF